MMKDTLNHTLLLVDDLNVGEEIVNAIENYGFLQTLVPKYPLANPFNVWGTEKEKFIGLQSKKYDEDHKDHFMLLSCDFETDFKLSASCLDIISSRCFYTAYIYMNFPSATAGWIIQNSKGVHVAAVESPLLSDDELVEHYLYYYEYDTVNDWAEDSDYDSEENENYYHKLLFAIEASGEIEFLNKKYLFTQLINDAAFELGRHVYNFLEN